MCGKAFRACMPLRVCIVEGFILRQRTSRPALSLTSLHCIQTELGRRLEDCIWHCESLEGSKDALPIRVRRVQEEWRASHGSRRIRFLR